MEAGAVGWLVRVVIAASHVTAVGSLGTALWAYPSAVASARTPDSGECWSHSDQTRWSVLVRSFTGL